MPRLFLKLFGTFWLTTVAILAISIFASFRLADDPGFLQFIDPREADAVLREVLDEGGVEGLREFLADSDNFPPGQTVYAVDETGSDLLGRPVPEALARRLGRMWRMVARDERLSPQRAGPRRPFRGFAPVLQAADGTRLLAIPGPAPPPRFGVFSRGGLRWLLLALAAITSLLSFWLLSRSLSRPAERISAAVDRFAAGDLSARAGPAGYSNDEIGEIARQFDRMAAALQAQAESRRELFRNVSHELRAPLARLQIATELLERKPEQLAAQLDRIRHEIDVLDALTGQVLSLARASQPGDAGEMVALVSVIERVAGDAELEAGDKGVELLWSAPPADLRIRAGEALLCSALENVVRNAVQATPTGGRVSMEIERRNGVCAVVVSDGGAGVPAGELDRIFEPFYRLDTNRPGSGIGLAITARVMERIGGTVSAKNGPGGGLVVTLEMPLAPRPGAGG